MNYSVLKLRITCNKIFPDKLRKKKAEGVNLPLPSLQGGQSPPDRTLKGSDRIESGSLEFMESLNCLSRKWASKIYFSIRHLFQKSFE